MPFFAIAAAALRVMRHLWNTDQFGLVWFFEVFLRIGVAGTVVPELTLVWCKRSEGEHVSTSSSWH